MKISEATIHRKPYGNHQMMITKLCTYDNRSHLDWTYRNLEKLRNEVEPNNWFYGRIRIPKFSVEVKKKQMMIKMEFMFGKQLNLSSVNQKWKDIVWNDMVNVKGHTAFKDYNLDNFIIRGTKPQGENEIPWEIAYVDLEAYAETIKSYRITSFLSDKQWQL